MSENYVEDKLRQVISELNEELQLLYSQNVLNHVDVKKIQNQAVVSKDAMLSTIDETTFNRSAKVKLLDALTRDFELSIQRTLDQAVSRKGEKALITHKINRVNRRILRNTLKYGISNSKLDCVHLAMNVLSSYIMRMLQTTRGRSKLSEKDIESIVENYEKSLIEYLPQREMLSKSG